MQGICRQRAGNVQGTLREGTFGGKHSRNIQGRNIQVTFREHPGNIQGAFSLS
jgi:hypothetical protein